MIILYSELRHMSLKKYYTNHTPVNHFHPKAQIKASDRIAFHLINLQTTTSINYGLRRVQKQDQLQTTVNRQCDPILCDIGSNESKLLFNVFPLATCQPGSSKVSTTRISSLNPITRLERTGIKGGTDNSIQEYSHTMTKAATKYIHSPILSSSTSLTFIYLKGQL